MILTPQEIAWVKDRMEVYVIEYQEIYDEVLDHILTAIEERREAGDTKEIQVVFQNVVDEHFNGYADIEALAIREEALYRKKIGNIFHNHLKQYFTWKALAITLALLAISYELPNSGFVHKGFWAGIFLLAFTPVIYAVVAIKGRIKTIRNKKSLLKTYVLPYTILPIALLNSVLFLPETFIDDDFKTLRDLPSVVLMAVFLFFLVTNVSYIQACREIINKQLSRLSS
jgi:hypothetical protein